MASPLTAWTTLPWTLHWIGRSKPTAAIRNGGTSSWSETCFEILPGEHVPGQYVKLYSKLVPW